MVELRVGANSFKRHRTDYLTKDVPPLAPDDLLDASVGTRLLNLQKHATRHSTEVRQHGITCSRLVPPDD